MALVTALLTLFAKCDPNHGCIVHVPAEIDVKAIRERIALSQNEFARQSVIGK